ncbi:hypothetical protein UVI_02036420 [Ustilaginoidea virens]|uniref:Uncharacterized protein n=1 Tax=Ustilaginoidea virens TaxID=1159556 RepID=A0A1B5L602_USTVR|nr:hypothetical protein UVI_02036420 [Ustilaginoidea virens]
MAGSLSHWHCRRQCFQCSLDSARSQACPRAASASAAGAVNASFPLAACSLQLAACSLQLGACSLPSQTNTRRARARVLAMMSWLTDQRPETACPPRQLHKRTDSAGPGLTNRVASDQRSCQVGNGSSALLSLGSVASAGFLASSQAESSSTLFSAAAPAASGTTPGSASSFLIVASSSSSIPSSSSAAAVAVSVMPTSPSASVFPGAGPSFSSPRSAAPTFSSGSSVTPISSMVSSLTSCASASAVSC